MDKETLSNYGWIVICVLVLAVMIALAGPFGNFVADAVKSTTQGLFDVNQGALDTAGITIDGQGFNDGKQNKYNMLDGDGQTITNAVDTTFRSEADYSKFVSLEIDGNVVDPSNYTISEGSTIITLKGEYVITITNGSHTITIVSTDGSATCIFIVNIDDTIIPVGGIYTTADGTTLNAGETFPETVNDGDVYVYGDYEYTYRTIGNGWRVAVTDTTKTAYGAILESINGEPTTSMLGTFDRCTSLVTAPVIPSSVTSMNATFSYCYNLTTAPTIPNSVEIMSQTFYNCTSLTTAPEIPSSVTNMNSTFYGCTSLTGTIEINVTNITTYSQCFNSTTKPITLTGTCPQLAELAATANNGNVTVQ